MNGVGNRAAVAGDAAAITAIYAHYVEHSVATFDTVPPSVQHWTDRIESSVAADVPFLVAETAGGVCGFAYLSAFRPKRAYRHTFEDTVYLAPDATGLGRGRLLLAELIARAGALGARQLVAVISTGEDGPSARLHRTLGFETAGRLREVGHKFDRWVDIVLMQRLVVPADDDRVAARG